MDMQPLGHEKSIPFGHVSETDSWRTRRCLVTMYVGSTLHGTRTAGSDTDIAQVVVPSRWEIMLGRIPKDKHKGPLTVGEGVKTAPDTTETTIYTLHHFVRMACNGETLALEMLNAPKSMWIGEPHAIWKGLVQRREAFYSKNISAFVGYARTQAAKYGVKGSRLDAVQKVVDFLKIYPEYERLESVWDVLPEGEHIRYHPVERNMKRMYEVCGRKVHETCTVKYARDVFQKYLDNYGERARTAATNEAIDWKAVAHAVRMSMQVTELLTQKTITLPMPQASLLRDIKLGKHDYTTVVAPLIETLMDHNEVLSARSSLPATVNQEQWDNWLFNVVDTATASG